jgi:chromosomal replication initiation ATPase DnaA
MIRRPDSTPAQLPLDLRLEPQYDAANFLVSPSNEVAYEAVSQWPDWPDRLLLLVGPEGCGKTHLAHVWAGLSGAALVPGARLGDHAPDQLAALPALVIEDIDAAPFDEARLFHLVNMARENGMGLLFTAHRRPDLWHLRTPDLLSRLRLAPVAEISAPDDALLRALLVKLFIDRGLMVDTSVIDYLVVRIERSFAGARRIVEALDREALALGRRLTRAVALRVLEQIPQN